MSKVKDKLEKWRTLELEIKHLKRVIEEYNECAYLSKYDTVKRDAHISTLNKHVDTITAEWEDTVALVSHVGERESIVLKLYYLEGLSMSEIANELNYSVRTIQRSLSRGISTLETLYVEEAA